MKRTIESWQEVNPGEVVEKSSKARIFNLLHDAVSDVLELNAENEVLNERNSELEAENAQLRAQATAWAKFWALPHAELYRTQPDVPFIALHANFHCKGATPDEAIAALLAKVE